MIIGGLQKLSLIDYPEKLACTVFCVGCSFKCPWCHNPELVLPEKMNARNNISEKRFFNFLKSRQGFLQGVCITGGEPTIHSDLLDFCKKIKEIGYEIKLDTNGSSPDILNELINQELVDYIAMDIKAPIKKYPEVIGIDVHIGSLGSKSDFFMQKLIENIKQSVELLKQNKVDNEFRTTIIPKLLNKNDILEIAKWISPAKRYFLQNFRSEKTIKPEFVKLKPQSLKYLLEIQKALAPFFDVCQIRE